MNRSDALSNDEETRPWWVAILVYVALVSAPALVGLSLTFAFDADYFVVGFTILGIESLLGAVGRPRLILSVVRNCGWFVLLPEVVVRFILLVCAALSFGLVFAA